MQQASIPFVNLSRQYAQLRQEIWQEIEQTWQQGDFTGGETVRRFEQSFADFLQHPPDKLLALNNGTSALHLALLALGIGPGDEVLLPTHTYIATAWAVSYVGAKPVFVEADPHTWTICPRAAAAAITPRSKALIAVHLYGQACDMASLLYLCKEKGLWLVEDTSQAHGALYEGKALGTWGDMGTFSFYPSKNLGTYGEGGAVVCKNKQQAALIAQLRNQGASQKYHHEILGYNMRLGTAEAAVLLVKLRYLAAWNTRRRHLAQRYQEALSLPELRFQQALPQSSSVYHLFVIGHPRRDALRSYLAEQGIETGLHYPSPCHLQEAYKDLGYSKGAFPVSEALAQELLSLPMFPELTEAEQDFVIDKINNFGK
jgi:dTDP-4-amino-4,6-dideoxygalactose transaminase